MTNPSALTPLRHRRDGWTAERQAGFLAALDRGALVTAAAAAVGMSREGAYRLRARPQAAAFAAAWAAVDAARQPGPEFAAAIAERLGMIAISWTPEEDARTDNRMLMRRLTALRNSRQRLTRRDLSRGLGRITPPMCDPV